MLGWFIVLYHREIFNILSWCIAAISHVLDLWRHLIICVCICPYYILGLCIRGRIFYFWRHVTIIPLAVACCYLFIVLVVYLGWYTCGFAICAIVFIALISGCYYIVLYHSRSFLFDLYYFLLYWWVSNMANVWIPDNSLDGIIWLVLVLLSFVMVMFLLYVSSLSQTSEAWLFLA